MKFNELGRSMVEMLGVLAIIGVLSVGAISGYSKAMDKYYWNRFIGGFTSLTVTAAEMCPKTKGEKININQKLYSLLDLPTGFRLDANKSLRYSPTLGFDYGWYWCVDSLPHIEFFGANSEFCEKILQYNWFANGATKVSIVYGESFVSYPSLLQISNACKDIYGWIVVYFVPNT